MAEASLFAGLLILVFAAAPLVFLVLLRLPAPYGRHARRDWGPELGPAAAWLLMEIPAVVAFLGFYLRGPRATGLVPIVFLGLWQTHYVERALVQPWSRRTRAPTPVVLVLLGVGYNVVNGYLNASWLTRFGPPYLPSWLWHPAFVVGILLFAVGFAVNRDADRRQRAQREFGEGRYGIPRGGLFERVSCPNYLGEIVQWLGWALATWSPAGFSFALFTMANLVPRALSHHRWYRERFPGYPPERKALVPFLL